MSESGSCGTDRQIAVYLHKGAQIRQVATLLEVSWHATSRCAALEGQNETCIGAYEVAREKKNDTEADKKKQGIEST